MSMGHHGGGGGGHGGGGRFRGGGGGGGFLFGPSYGVVDDDDSDYVLVRRPRVSFMGEMLETLDSELFNTTKNPISRRFEIGDAGSTPVKWIIAILTVNEHNDQADGEMIPPGQRVFVVQNGPDYFGVTRDSDAATKYTKKSDAAYVLTKLGKENQLSGVLRPVGPVAVTSSGHDKDLGSETRHIGGRVRRTI